MAARHPLALVWSCLFLLSLPWRWSSECMACNRHSLSHQCREQSWSTRPRTRPRTSSNDIHVSSFAQPQPIDHTVASLTVRGVAVPRCTFVSGTLWSYGRTEGVCGGKAAYKQPTNNERQAVHGRHRPTNSLQTVKGKPCMVVIGHELV